MMAKDDPDKIDLNLDEEPVADSPDQAAAELAEALRAAAASVPEGAPPAAAERLAKVQAEKDELMNMLIRRQADFDNYRKRVERERGEDRQRATTAVIEQLLPVLDGFERALAAPRSFGADPGYEDYRKGFELIYRQIVDALTRYGLEPIEAVGQPFDPNLHHAVDTVDDPELEDGVVVHEHQRGYRLRDTVVRPSMVRVVQRRGPGGGGSAE